MEQLEPIFIVLDFCISDNIIYYVVSQKPKDSNIIHIK